MVFACLVATVHTWNGKMESLRILEEEGVDQELYDPLDGPSEEEAYREGNCLTSGITIARKLNQLHLGEYKTILQLVSVLSKGKTAKAITDRAIDLMEDVQNLRKAIYE